MLITVCTLLSVFIGFFVAAACGYMAGLVGSSSSPISGIGIISVVVISCLLSWLSEKVTGLMVLKVNSFNCTYYFSGSIVVSTAAISNDNLQDLKRTF